MIKISFFLFFFFPLVLTSIVTAKQDKGKFILMIMLYNETHPERIEEYKKCFDINMAHESIECIHVMYDMSKDDNENILYSYLEENGAIITKVNGRATFGYFFNEANRLYPNQKVIVSNADIYFDETLNLLLDYNLDKIFIALTRYDKKGGKFQVRSRPFRGGKPDPTAQDTWIFETPVIISGSERICLGVVGCDPAIAYKAAKAGYKVINCSYEIKCYHVHGSQIRHYRCKDSCREPRKKTEGSLLFSKKKANNI